MRSMKLALCAFISQTKGTIGYLNSHVIINQRMLSSRRKIPNKLCSRRRLLEQSALCSSPQDEDNDDDGEFFEAGGIGAGPEQSQLYDYISDFLKKEKSSTTSSSVGDNEATEVASPSSSTHLIAIPVDNNNELLLELESVQRAILYHCPVLVHACITNAMMRLPLLYVDATGSSNDGDGTGRVATSRLNDMVRTVVKENIFVADNSGANGNNDEVESAMDEVQREDGSVDLSGANEDGIQPLMIPFQSLEIDGDGNEALLTVAKESSPGTKKLVKLVQELRERIHKETGWTTMLPPDPHSPGITFRPRIPFMRLPENWEEYLEKDPDKPDEYLTSDQGGNGISPILWGQWMDDDFGGEANRMREVAVYPCPFYLPSHSVQLPKGNAALAKIEAEFQEYQEQRMTEAEILLEEERGDKDAAAAADITETDPLFTKTRERLENQLNEGQSIPVDYLEESLTMNDRDSSEEASLADLDDEDLDLGIKSDRDERPEDPSALDDWMRDRVRQAVDSRARVQSEKELSTTKEKPSIESNPIFKRYKEGTLVPEKDKPPPPRELPPFPSRDHCFGFWRVVSSPTGFEVEEGASYQMFIICY